MCTKKVADKLASFKEKAKSLVEQTKNYIQEKKNHKRNIYPCYIERVSEGHDIDN